jgi:hypothetical protein
MTVGQEVCRRTGFALFHGHVVGDVVAAYFPFGTPSFARLSQTWRRTFIEEAARAGVNLVTTVAWRFDVPGDAEAIASWLRPYTEAGRVLCVELVAPLDVRIERNHSENRRRHKTASWVTDDYLRATHTAHRYDSGGVFPFELPHLRLEIEQLPAEAAADRIIEHFDLPRLDNLNS